MKSIVVGAMVLAAVTAAPMVAQSSIVVPGADLAIGLAAAKDAAGWAMMIVGLGAVGVALRRQRRERLSYAG